LIPGLLDISTSKFREQSENVYENKEQCRKVDGVEPLKVGGGLICRATGPAEVGSVTVRLNGFATSKFDGTKRECL